MFGTARILQIGSELMASKVKNPGNNYFVKSNSRFYKMNGEPGEKKAKNNSFVFQYESRRLPHIIVLVFKIVGSC